MNPKAMYYLCTCINVIKQMPYVTVTFSLQVENVYISVANPGNGIVIMQEKHLKILVIVLYSTITRSCSGWLCFS